MPTKLQQVLADNALGNYSQARRAARQLAAQAGAGYQTARFRGPWRGFEPDLDGNLATPTSAQALENMIARDLPDGRGEALTIPEGYNQVDGARLPLGDGATLPASPVTDGTAVVALTQLARLDPAGADAGTPDGANYTITPIAATAGDSVTSGSGNLYRIPGSGQWEQIPYSANSFAARALTADRDGRPLTGGGTGSFTFSMPDSCVAPFGAQARAFDNGGGSVARNITEPCLIYTNDVDGVMVYPFESAVVSTYGHLVGNTAGFVTTAAAQYFKAKSCETFNGRVYFLNTEENGVRRPNRLRRTARFTADVNPTAVGAGFIDLNVFEREGLRIETLGDVMVAYFQDGVAFVAPTGIATMPDNVQVITRERGLLGTHAVTPIGRSAHLGIFTDGWWRLDESGRWQEVGITNIDGVPVHKWSHTFFNRLDLNNAHRIHMHHDEAANLIYIAVPTKDTLTNDVEEVWIYDLESDRVFIEKYPVTCFGSFYVTAQSASLWSSFANAITWFNIGAATWATFGQIFGPKTRVHGDLNGMVYSHSPDFATFDGSDINWYYQSHLRSLPGARSYTTLDRVAVEYFDTRLAALGVEALGGPSDGSQTQSIPTNLSTNQAGDLRTAQAFFRYSAPGVGVKVSGSGPAIIRAMEIDLWADEAETRGL